MANPMALSFSRRSKNDPRDWKTLSVYSMRWLLQDEDANHVQDPSLLVPCVKCNRPTLFHENVLENVSTGELRFESKAFSGPCDTCVQSELIKAERDEWNRKMTCAFPSLFARTVESRLPREQTIAAFDWAPTPDIPGLLLHGPTGTCKTRLAVRCAQRLGERSSTIPVWMPACDFSHQCQTKFSNDGGGPAWVGSLCTTGVLLVDDLGKGRLTERVQTELFSLLETRFSNGRTTILTCNVAGEGLLQSFSPDIGPPLLRRLREFCVAIGFSKL